MIGGILFTVLNKILYFPDTINQPARERDTFQLYGWMLQGAFDLLIQSETLLTGKII